MKPKILPQTQLLIQTSVFFTISFVYLFYVTYGTFHIFDHQPLGSIFDAQALAFLNFHVDVDSKNIGLEKFLNHGLNYIYWGPWPAFIRMPALFLLPEVDGIWNRLSCFVAMETALLFWALILNNIFEKNKKKWIWWSVFMLAFGLGTPLLWLISSTSVYHEAIIWATAASIGCLHFFFLIRKNGFHEKNLLGFAICLSIAFLSRATYAFPWLMVSAYFVFLEVKNKKWHFLKEKNGY